MTSNQNVPVEVSDATLINFGHAITAFLHQPEIEGFSLVGRVYFDHKNRFENGRLIRTSDIVEFAEIANHFVAITLTGSAYVLIAPSCELLTG
ncbi:hypothetical protein GIW45_12120 [Pseudomonas congelans]|uniref:hypothetical protein n=1 Tax=Pseudomonas congelans TaxID=200452 RepID=UPI001F2B5595|nr:hypothetical protein [Pseudomonas congelans]MCF5164794.1 hypothetical protein [Pseudomonas congelans]